MRFSVIGTHLASRLTTLILLGSLAGCVTSGGSGEVRGNENGSSPINENESVEYQKSINRCTKTGGTRVVKIKGELRCY